MPERNANDAVDFRRIVSRIAPYRPFSSGADRVDYARRQFVLAAAHENGGRLASCEECQAICETMWGLALEREEIFSSMKSLVRTHELSRDHNDQLVLSSASSEELADRIRRTNEVEAAAFAEWENTVIGIAPSLDDEHLGCLRDDLMAWIHRLIREYGVEAALLLFPEDPRYDRFLGRVEALGFEFLPARDSGVMLSRRDALLAFMTRMTSMQRRFLSNLLTTAHLMAVFTLDPAALEHVQELLTGQVLYMDTNVVYSILGLAGPRKQVSTKRVLDLSRQLGYRTCVTPWTVTETQESMRSAHFRLIRSQPSPQDLLGPSAEMSDSDAEEAFVRAFRQVQRDTGIRIDDFVSLHDQVESLLAYAGIEVVSSYCDEIDESGRIDEQIAVLERARGTGEGKPRPVQEHDVKHRLLVERIRGPEKRQFANAGCMFLTNDNAVVRYANAGKSSLPFASSLENWEKIVRNLNPRTADYDKTMIDLLDTPIFSSTTPASSQEISDALARISAFERHPPDVSTRVLLDSAISVKTREVEERASSPRSPHETARVLELRELLEAERSDHARQIRVVEGRLAAGEGQLSELRELLERERNDHARQLGALEERLAVEGGHISELRGELETERRRTSALTEKPMAEFRVVERASAPPPMLRETGDAAEVHAGAEIIELKKLVSLLIALLISVIGVAVLAVPIGTGWITSGWPLVGDILVAGATFAGAYASRFGFKRTIGAITFVASVLTIVAAVQAFVS